jgi:hypothetical protein
MSTRPSNAELPAGTPFVMRDWMRRVVTRERIGALLVVVVVLCVAVYKSAYLTQVPRGDVTYDVAVARQLVHGDGLTTNLLPLGAFDRLVSGGRASVDPWPSFHKFILPQVVLAPFVAVFGPTLEAARVSSLLQYTLIVLTIFGVLSRALRSVPYALGFAVAFVAFDELNCIALTGLGACGDVLVFFLAVVVWALVPDRPKLAPLAGVLLALTVLERYSFLLFVPFLLLGALRSAGRGPALRASVAAAAVLGPIVLWSYLRYGSMFPSPQGEQLFLFGTKYFPTDTWYTASWPRPTDGLADLPHELARKVLSNARLLVEILFPSPLNTVRNIAITLAAAVGAVRVWRTRPQLRAVLVVGAAFVCTYVGAHLFIGFSYRYIAFAFPCIWVLACIAVHDASRAAAAATRVGPSWAWATIIIGLLVAPDIVRSYQGEIWVRANARECPGDRYCNHEEITSFLRAHHPTTGLLVSGGNLPWDLALATHNRVAPILPSPDDLGRYRRAGVPFDLVLIPADLSFAGDGLRPPGWLLWEVARDARLPSLDGLALEHAFSDGSVLYARAPGVPEGVDYCALPSGVDMHRERDRRLTSPNLRFVEHKGDEAWSWVEGSHAEVTVVTCRRARRFAARLLVAEPGTDVEVTVNGRRAGTLTFAAPLGWQDSVVELPDDVVVEGVNRVALDAVKTQGPLPQAPFAIARVALSPP